MGNSASRDISEIFKLHGPLVHRRAHQLLGSREDAADALQEVFIRAMQGLANFEERSSMSTWLYQITTNYCLAVLRDRGNRQRLFRRNITAPDSESAAPTTIDLVLLRQLFAEADEEQARAVIYVYIDGMNHELAASVMGVSRRTVGNLIERFFEWAQKRHGQTRKPAPLEVVRVPNKGPVQ